MQWFQIITQYRVLDTYMWNTFFFGVCINVFKYDESVYIFEIINII